MQPSSVPLPGRVRRSRVAVVAAVVAALATLLATALTWSAPASAATTPLVGVGSGRCLDVSASQTNGAQAQLWDCNGQANQQLDLTPRRSAAGLRHQVPGRLRRRAPPTAPRDHLGLQRPDQPAVEPQRRRHHHRRRSPDCAWTPTAPAPPTAPRSSSGRATAAPTSSGPAGAAPTPTPTPTPRRPARARATSTPRAARRASPRTARPGRSTAPTTATSTRSGARRTTRPGTSACWPPAASPTPRPRTRSAPAPRASSRSSTTSPGAATTCGTRDPAWSPARRRAGPAMATTESLTVGGSKAYSLYINPGNSYWRDGHLTGVPTGSAPEGMYMVTSGTHVNSGCCFDYGNSETTRRPTPPAPWTRSTSAPSAGSAAAPGPAPGSRPTSNGACTPAAASPGTPTSGPSPASSSPPC